LASAHGTAGAGVAGTDMGAAVMHLAHVADTQDVQAMLVRPADTPVEQPVARPLRLAADLAVEPVLVVDSVAAAMQVAADTAVVDTANIGVSAS